MSPKSDNNCLTFAGKTANDLGCDYNAVFRMLLQIGGCLNLWAYINAIQIHILYLCYEMCSEVQGCASLYIS